MEDQLTAHDFCPFAEPSFQREVIEALTYLKNEAQATNVHLASLNSAVARHTEQIGHLQIWRATEEAEQKTSKAWARGLLPILMFTMSAILGAIITLMLIHAGDFLRVQQSVSGHR